MPSIQPKQSAVSTASSQVMLGAPEPLLWNPTHNCFDSAWCRLSHARNADEALVEPDPQLLRLRMVPPEPRSECGRRGKEFGFERHAVWPGPEAVRHFVLVSINLVETEATPIPGAFTAAARATAPQPPRHPG